MPLRIYCPGCSEPNEYTLTKPSFCSHCGSKMTADATAVKPITKPTVAAQTETEEVPNLAKLDIDLNQYAFNSVKLGDLGFQQKTGFERPAAKSVDVAKEVAEFRKEAGLGGRKTIEIEDNGSE